MFIILPYFNSVLLNYDYITNVINLNTKYIYIYYLFIIVKQPAWFVGFYTSLLTAPLITQNHFVFIPTPLIKKIALIHPFSLISLTILLLIYLNFNKQNLNFIKITYLGLFVLISGCFWASQEVLWGGFWNWDYTELSLVWINLFTLCYIHTQKIYDYHLLVTIFIIVLLSNHYVFFKSIHKFTNTLINKIAFILVIHTLVFVNWNTYLFIYLTLGFLSIYININSLNCFNIHLFYTFFMLKYCFFFTIVQYYFWFTWVLLLNSFNVKSWRIHTVLYLVILAYIFVYLYTKNISSFYLFSQNIFHYNEPILTANTKKLITSQTLLNNFYYKIML